MDMENSSTLMAISTKETLRAVTDMVMVNTNILKVTSTMVCGVGVTEKA